MVDFEVSLTAIDWNLLIILVVAGSIILAAIIMAYYCFRYQPPSLVRRAVVSFFLMLAWCHAFWTTWRLVHYEAKPVTPDQALRILAANGPLCLACWFVICACAIEIRQIQKQRKAPAPC